MKKNLLFIALISFLAFGVKAQQLQKSTETKILKKTEQKALNAQGNTMVIGYTFDCLGGIGIGTNAEAKLAIGFTKEQLQKYVGAKITKLEIAIYNGAVTNSGIFLSDKLDTNPAYTQDASFTGGAWNTITLTTPYEIEADKDVYIGYYLKTGSTASYPIGYGESPAAEKGNLIYVNNTWQKLSDLNASLDYNISIVATLEGDNLPQYNLSLVQLNYPKLVQKDKEFSISGIVQNIAAGEITSYDVVYKIGDAAEVTVPITTSPFGNLGYSSFEVENISISSEAFDLPLTLTIANINGNPDEDPSDNSGSGTITSLENIFPKKFVAEEATGTWCQYCPRGAVNMALMKEKYPDSFIGIAVHNNDPMQVTTYNNGIASYIQKIGYPSVVVNRSLVFDPGDLERNYLSGEHFSTISVELSAIFTDDKKSNVKLSANGVSAIDISNANYRFAFVVIENGVTGTASSYAQSNYYSGRGEQMGGFENLPNPVPASQMVYDDVARGILSSFTGISSSVPTNIQKGVPFNYEYNLKVPTVVNNIDNTEMIVLLLNYTTGEIINAAKIHADEIGSGISDEKLAGFSTIVTKAGSNFEVNITTETPQNISVDLLSIDGKMIQSLPSVWVDAEYNFSLPVATSGLYLVRINTEAGAIVKKAIF